MLLRGFLAGAFLAYATSLVIVVLSQGLPSIVGTILAMWLPIMTFFALGFEHSIVNMFVIPVAMLFGAPISIRQWWFWNQLPVTVGNIVSGALLTGLALYVTHSPKRILSIEPAQASQPEARVALEQAAGVQAL